MAKVEAICPDCKQKSACFRQLDQGELDFADKSKVQIRYKKGETIAKQGSFVTHVLYVKHGLVKVYREHNDETNLIYSIVPAGSLVGLTNIYILNTYEFSVASLTDSSICSIDRQVLEQLVTENGAFAGSVVKSLNRETRQLRNKLASLTHKPLEGRLADSLIYLEREVFQSRVFSHKLSRNDLAEFSGMSMMSAVRTMQEFIKRGYVAENEGRIELKNVEALKEISQRRS